MQRGAPPHEGVVAGRAPERRHQRADQQRLHHGHLRVRWHLETAELQEPQAAAGRVRAVQLVDAELGTVRVAREVGQQVAQHTVDEPGPAREVSLAGDTVVLGPLRPVVPGRELRLVRQARELGERDVHLVHRLGASLVEPGSLAGRTDEAAGEQVRQRGVALPVPDQAAEQVGTTEQGRVRGGRPPERDVVAAAGAGVGPVEVELLGAQPGPASRVVERVGQVAQLAPRARRLEVDLDDARVGGHDELRQPGVRRRGVALDHDSDVKLGGDLLERRDEGHVVVEPLRGRQEHEDEPVTSLERECRGWGVVRLDRHDARQHRRQRRSRLEVRGIAGRFRRQPRDRVERQTKAHG